jgi:hypothetical protein
MSNNFKVKGDVIAESNLWVTGNIYYGGDVINSNDVDRDILLSFDKSQYKGIKKIILNWFGFKHVG